MKKEIEIMHQTINHRRKRSSLWGMPELHTVFQKKKMSELRNASETISACLKKLPYEFEKGIASKQIRK